MSPPITESIPLNLNRMPANLLSVIDNRAQGSRGEGSKSIMNASKKFFSVEKIR